jgi:DNA-binding helix-hairpin-helix protein with protein kinase domain
MPRVPDMFSVIDLFVPKSRLEKCPLFTYQYLHRAARNIAAAIAPLHARGYVVGDINESNILVSTSALISLVDTDSFQVRDAGGKVFRCAVGKAEFTPPELQGRVLRDVDRAAAHDLFGLGVLIFQLLMEGTHPFAGQYNGSGDPPSIVTRIQQGRFPYGSAPGDYAPPPIAPDFTMPDPEIRDLFLRCFEQGHANPGRRPTATVWQETLDRAEARLKRCRRNSQHRYGGHLKSCPWCARAELLGGRDYYPSQKSVQSGIHLAPPAPKQTALPALQSTAAGGHRRAPSRVRRATGKKPNRFGLQVALKWSDLARSHPYAHVAISVSAGALCLGGLRLALREAVSPMYGWLAPVSGISYRSGFSLALASLALASAGTAGVWYVIRGRKP